ncbi:peptidase domain-containing ABC transporter [Sphingobacterium multivorum]|uniref:peptidase domain-containing ABC transporter n=1 Tax=Sphingobacterium multivorum TaxID=28454 RepID=UPI0031BB3253
MKAYKQLNSSDCGQTCIRIIASYYGKEYSLSYLKNLSGYTKSGTSMLALSKLAENIKLKSRAVRISFDSLMQINQAVMIHWKDNHYVVLDKIIRGDKVRVIDPAVGRLVYTKTEFLNCWSVNDAFQGHALILEPAIDFLDTDLLENQNKLTLLHYFRYLKKCKTQIISILVAFVFSLFTQLIAPFIMKSVIDVGIEGKNFSFIQLITVAQLILLVTGTIVGFIETRISVRMSNILNLSILSDFWSKLTSLPIAYFDRYHTGDTLKRLGDHSTIQSFMTGTSINLIKSIVNFVIYTIILLYFNNILFAIFLAGNAVYFGWIWIFLGIRRKLNYKSFELGAKNSNNTIQFVEGMKDIKLNNAELPKRWQWERIQIELFKFAFKTIDYNQIQSAGALLITQMKNITLSLIVAKQVIDGQISLGTMISVQYILAQLNGPLQSFIGFVQQTQDAKISLERLNDIHEITSENEEGLYNTNLPPISNFSWIHINNLSYRYPGAETYAIKNISMHIPVGKTTAFVGTSGCGKSTLLKILMRSYIDYEGEILLDKDNFSQVNPFYWRSQAGFVTHEGFIFNDSVLNNIALGDVEIDIERAIQCCRLANIYEFIITAPKGIHSIIGTEGIGLSQGQKQRILIARALYKNPEILFLDEPTNSLDVNNEQEIIKNLDSQKQGKTLIVVAHRLSTIKNADHIVVLNNGEVAEQGTHQELLSLKGIYWQYFEKQIEYVYE